ncbi:hypothetical protein PG994_009888 [Apiospora phragmitis]|uniref:Uncharacterized protein n=1 Tax=Apiospora phragmitis TaxID=2905665 RepID=A0ABR1TNI6_9PEZI
MASNHKGVTTTPEPPTNEKLDEIPPWTRNCSSGSPPPYTEPPSPSTSAPSAPTPSPTPPSTSLYTVNTPSSRAPYKCRPTYGPRRAPTSGATSTARSASGSSSRTTRGPWPRGPLVTEAGALVLAAVSAGRARRHGRVAAAQAARGLRVSAASADVLGAGEGGAGGVSGAADAAADVACSVLLGGYAEADG